MRLRQYKLSSDNEKLMTFLEDGQAKVGDSITLRDYHDEKRLWKIEEAYGVVDSKDEEKFELIWY